MLQLWSQIVEGRRYWNSIHQYMAHRAAIPNCQGQGGLTGETGVRWFAMENSEIDGFVACEACYQDLILATSFADCFRLAPRLQADDVTISCDLAVPYIQRALEEYSLSKAWRGFVDAVAIRLQLPACAGLQPVEASSTIWYAPRARISDLAICGTCYHDSIGLLPMDDEFYQLNIPPARGSEQWICDMAVIPMKLAWMEAVSTQNYQLWWNAAKSIMEHPPCTADGIMNGTWYTLVEDCSGFGICGRCYAGIIEAQGYVSYFTPIACPPGTAYVCDFNPGKARCAAYFRKLAEASSTNTWSVFADYVLRVVSLPACPKATVVENRGFYGTEYFLVCESCYEEVVSGTSLAPRLSYGQVAQGSCHVYSPRMRTLWAEACATQDLEAFTVLARHRTAMYQQTIRQIQVIRAEEESRRQMQSSLFISSILLEGSDAQLSLFKSPNHKHEYGNSTVGYRFASSIGVEGAMKYEQARKMRVVRPEDYVEIARLEALWKAVE